MINIRPANIEDADNINVREVDVREIWRTSLSDPNRAVKRSIMASREAWTALWDGEIMAIFGVCDLSVLNRVGTPWLIGSDLLLEHKKEFLKYTIEYMEKVKYGYSKLVNYIDDENEVTKHWLKWLGFKLEEPLPYGAIGKKFRRFTMEIAHV